MAAAEDHYSDIGDKGLLSHKGSDGSTYKDRIEKYCRWGGGIFEAMDFGHRQSAEEVVVAWLVDDGVEKRTHRNSILEPRLIFIGVAKGSHSVAD